VKTETLYLYLYYTGSGQIVGNTDERRSPPFLAGESRTPSLYDRCVICSGLGSLEYFVIIKCTKFGQLILRKIIKIVATRCQILRLKCIKFDLGWGSAPDPAGGAYKRSHRPPSWI